MLRAGCPLAALSRTRANPWSLPILPILCSSPGLGRDCPRGLSGGHISVSLRPLGALFLTLAAADVFQAVRRLKAESEGTVWVGGVTLPVDLADMGLIDEYEFLVQPVLAGHRPRLLSGVRERIALELIARQEFRSGAYALRYRPTRDPTR